MGIRAIKAGKRIEDPPADILSGIDLEIANGEFIALTGKSGSGKSTLLYLLSTLDKPSFGSIEIDGRKIEEMSVEEICDFRNRKAGFVFQFHYLIAELSALENVLLPARRENRAKEKRDFALHLLEQLDLKEKIRHLPRQLSGGQAQRVAIARALVMSPKYIFADEPTGSLDSANAKLVIDILFKAKKELSSTIVLVTHDPEFANMADRQIHLTDGKLTHPA